MKKKNRGKIISYLLLAAISILMLFPFFWMVRSSFMTNREIMTVPIQWLPSHYNLDNFRDAFARAPFSRYFVNSGIIVLINMIGSILSASFIAFGFSRLRFTGKKFLVCPAAFHNDDTADRSDDTSVSHMAGSRRL